MERQEVLDYAEVILQDELDWGNQERAEALRTIIKAFKQEPYADAISRKAVYRILNKNHRIGARDIDGDWIDGNYDEKLLNEIIALPSVQPKVKKGHWIDDCVNLKCPYCETRVSDVKVFSPLTKYTNACWFCPICGADMREVKE